MPRMFFFAMMMLALIMAPPFAQSATVACLTPDNVLARIGQTVRSDEIIRLQGREAEKFLAAFNVLPPQTHHMADAFLVVTSKRLPTHVVFAFQSGCMIGRASLDREVSTRILAAIIGVGA
jgi:hypothetical protein